MTPTSDRWTSRCITAVLFCSLLTIYCTGSDRDAVGGNELKLNDEVYGFFLGEAKDELFERARYKATLEKLDKVELSYRGELWYCSRPLVNARGVEYVRLAFFDDHLWEVIIYFKNTSIQHLNRLKEDLEERYQASAKSPDGTVETVYKTYRIPGPGMSITVRRITKPDGTELYVQYMHNELHRRLKKLKEESG